MEVNKELANKVQLAFPLLSDTREQVIRWYDVLHAGAGPQKQDIARPAEFLIDPTGIVRGVYLTNDFRVRARGDLVLKATENMDSKP